MPFLSLFRTGHNRLAVSLACLVALLAALAAAVHAESQTIANGSFEQSSPDGEPEFWEVQARGLAVDLDDAATGVDGNALRVADNGSGGSALITQQIDLGASGFSGATLRGRIRTRDIAPSATLVAILEGPEGRLFMDDMNDRVVAGDTEWREYTIYIPASEAARSLTVGALVIGSGTAWFDQLELIDESSPAAADGDARAYVLEALSVMREHYLHADDVDWERIRETGLAALADGASSEQTRAAVAMMIERLEDPHASLARPPSDSPAPLASESGEPVTAELLDGQIGLVRVPRVPGRTSEEGLTQFADNAHRVLESIDSPELCGWIIDLRENTGGNMWPMLAAIGPIAGPGVLGRFRGREETEVSEWIYRDGAARVSSGSDTIERTAVSVEPFEPERPDLPVAVLVSGNTSSSGEATAIAFIGRDNTRLFGSETGGLATANNVYPLSDGSRIVLPIGYMADRHGNIHHPHVDPHESVAPDDALKPAMRWLQSQADCTD